MFTVIQSQRRDRSNRRAGTYLTTWIVWCGWQNKLSAEYYSFEEACADAALKEWFYQHTLWR